MIEVMASLEHQGMPWQPKTTNNREEGNAGLVTHSQTALNLNNRLAREGNPNISGSMN